MRKIMIMLTALLFGVVLQAQEFDFSCEDLPNFGVVKIKVKIAGDDVAPLGVVDLEKHENPPNVLVDATTISLEDGYEVGSKIFYEPYENYPGVPGLQYYFNTKEVGATDVRVSVRAQSTFDFTQDDFTMDLSGVLSDTFTSVPPNEGSVLIGVIIGTTDMVNPMEWKFAAISHDSPVKKADYKYTLADGYEVIEDIVYEPFQDHPTIPNIQYYFNTKYVGNNGVGISIRTLAGFDFTQDDFNVDFTEFFADKIALVEEPEPDFGSLGLLINGFDPDGTPATIGNKSRNFLWDIRVSTADVVDGSSVELSASTVDYTYGNAHIHLFENIAYEPTNIVNLLVTSSDFDRFEDETIVGGVMAGYVLVENGSSYDVFAKWDKDATTSWSLAVVTHSNFGWSWPHGFKRRIDFSTGNPVEPNIYDDRYGNLETLLEPYNGDEYEEYGDIVNEFGSRDFWFYAKEDSENVNDNGLIFENLNPASPSGYVGNAKVFHRSFNSQTIWPHVSSTDSKFNAYRIKGGIYDGYVRVYGSSNGTNRHFDVFAIWTEWNNTGKVVIVTYPDLNWATNSKVVIEADFWDGW